MEGDIHFLFWSGISVRRQDRTKLLPFIYLCKICFPVWHSALPPHWPWVHVSVNILIQSIHARVLERRSLLRLFLYLRKVFHLRCQRCEVPYPYCIRLFLLCVFNCLWILRSLQGMGNWIWERNSKEIFHGFSLLLV